MPRAFPFTVPFTVSSIHGSAQPSHLDRLLLGDSLYAAEIPENCPRCGAPLSLLPLPPGLAVEVEEPETRSPGVGPS